MGEARRRGRVVCVWCACGVRVVWCARPARTRPVGGGPCACGVRDLLEVGASSTARIVHASIVLSCLAGASPACVAWPSQSCLAGRSVPMTHEPCPPPFEPVCDSGLGMSGGRLNGLAALAPVGAADVTVAVAGAGVHFRACYLRPRALWLAEPAGGASGNRNTRQAEQSDSTTRETETKRRRESGRAQEASSERDQRRVAGHGAGCTLHSTSYLYMHMHKHMSVQPEPRARPSWLVVTSHGHGTHARDMAHMKARHPSSDIGTRPVT